MTTQIHLQHASFLTQDNLDLPALFYTHSSQNKKVIIFLHGNGSASVFYKAEKMRVLAEIFAENGWAFFAFNNRGAHYIKKFQYQKNGENKQRFLGTALEKIEECVLDIEGAISFLKKQGYDQVILIGESSGANKICVYNHYRPDNSCKGYALIGGGDDTGLWYEQLGQAGFETAIQTAQEKMATGNGEELLTTQISHGLMTHQALLDTIDPDGDYNCFPFVEASKDIKLSSKPLFHFFAEITKPMLVLYGENDIFCVVAPREAIEILKKHHPQSEKITGQVEADADHSFSGKNQEEARAVAEWLKTIA